MEAVTELQKVINVNPVPRSITGPPCHLGDANAGTSLPGWGLDVILMTLLFKNIIVVRSKEVKTR